MPPLSSASPRTLAPGPPAPEPAPIQSKSNQQPAAKIGFVPEQVGQALPPANSAPGPAAPPAEDAQPLAPSPRPPIWLRSAIFRDPPQPRPVDPPKPIAIDSVGLSRHPW